MSMLTVLAVGDLFWCPCCVPKL